MKGWSMLASNLVINFTKEFKNDMGLKSLTNLAFSTFGIRVMY
jgi:hypothetical protein